MSAASEAVAAAIQRASESLHMPQTLDETLQAIVQATRTSIVEFDLVGVSTVDKRGNIETRAVSDPQVKVFDDIQYSLDDGPCVDAMTTDRMVVVVPAIRRERRWPVYVREAVRLGLRSQLAIKLLVDQRGTLGGLNLYSRVSDEIYPESEHLAELFATHAAIALGSVSAIDELRESLRSRTVIGQATGIIMERYGLDETAAFAFLTRISNGANVSLRRAAHDIVEQARPHR